MARRKNNSSDDEMMKFTIQHVVEKLDAMDTKLDKVHIQTTKTNGRVTKLEKSSVGMWFGNNYVKGVLIIMAILAILISDSREILIEALIKAFTGL